MHGIQEGTLNVDEAEALLPPGLMTASERWLFYFSLRAAEVELRDSRGRIVTPDDLVPEHRRRRRTRVVATPLDRAIDYDASADLLLDDQLS